MFQKILFRSQEKLKTESPDEPAPPEAQEQAAMGFLLEAMRSAVDRLLRQSLEWGRIEAANQDRRTAMRTNKVWAPANPPTHILPPVWFERSRPPRFTTTQVTNQGHRHRLVERYMDCGGGVIEPVVYRRWYRRADEPIRRARFHPLLPDTSLSEREFGQRRRRCNTQGGAWDCVGRKTYSIPWVRPT